MSNEVAELACTYAALILHDDGQDITGDKIATLVKAAGIDVQSYWPKLFAKAIEGKDITSFFNFGGAVQASSGPAQPAAKQQEAPKQQAKKKQQKVKEEPKQQEEDGGMGGLFD